MIVNLLGAAPAAPDTLRLTLAGAVRVALEQSPAAATARLTRTDGAITLARGINQLLPAASGSVSRRLGGSPPAESTGAWSSTLTINQVIFGSSAFADVVTACLRAGTSSTSARDQLARVAYDATVDYLGLLRASELKRVADAAFARAAANLALAQEKRRLGAASQIELLRAQVQESQARLARIQADHGLGSARAAFRTTAGLDRNQTVIPADELAAPAGYAVGDRDSLLGRIRGANPGLKLAASARTVAGIGTAAAAAGILPTVNAYWSAGLDNRPLPDALTDWRNAETTWGIRANIPLLDLKSYVLNVADAASSARRAAIAVRAAELSLEQSAADAVDGYIEARAAFEQASANLELSGRLRALAEEQLRLGAASQLDYLQADADYIAAQSALINATCDTYIKAARIEYLQGRVAELAAEE